MTRLRGRAQSGERVRGAVPHGHWKTSTFVAALRHDRPAAPFVVDGPMNGTIFLEYVRQVLCPELMCGAVVILDHLASLKVTGVREAIQATRATLLYLPLYSQPPIPSNQPSPNSKPCSVRPQHEPYLHTGMP